MEQSNVTPLLKCYLSYLRNLVGIEKGLTVVDYEDYQWMKNTIVEFLNYNHDYYPNEFYKVTNDEIESLQSEIKNSGTLTLDRWNGQTTIIVGCGHVNTENSGVILDDGHYQMCSHYHNPELEYLVDVDISILPDMCINFCESPLSLAIPEAHGQIKEIMVEGICLDETDVFYNDCLLLLENNGIVTLYDKTPILIKLDGKLYAYVYDSDNNCKLELYRPWTQKDIDDKTFGFDIFDWKGQFIRNGWRFPELQKSAMDAVTIIKFIDEINVS